MRNSVLIRFSLIWCSSALDGRPPTPNGAAQSRWRDILGVPADFYGTPESIRVAENVLLYQNDNGGWPKNIDMAASSTTAKRRSSQKLATRAKR